jgi:hypothetical protein
MFIPWWCFALLPLILGVAGALAMPQPRDYDFMTPMLTLGILVVGFVATICLFIGHWL